MRSIEIGIRQKINRSRRGTIFFPKDFRKFGSSEGVRLALHRLHNGGIIRRVGQGVYVLPKQNKYIGEVLPSVEEVANAIARRDKIRLIPTGAYAVNALGLSTQIPMNLVFLTDGSPREIKIGKRTIKLKKTTPKNLSVRGNISALVIQALREIGETNLTEIEKNKILELLKEENKKDLLHDIELAPVWMQKIMKQTRINE